MKERLSQILQEKGLTAADFAKLINVAPGAISHILRGRNNPSYDLLVNIAKAIPDIDMYWLLTGEGSMSVKPDNKEKSTAQLSLFDEPEKNEKVHKETRESTGKIPAEIIGNMLPQGKSPRSLKKIILFYSDGSFEDYSRD